MKKFFLLTVMFFLGPAGLAAQGQKITIAAVDSCGFMIKGTVTITATVAATSPVAVTSIQMQVDGANIGMPLVPPNFSTPWDSTTVSNACHVITAIVADSAGNSVTVTIPVSVKNK